MTNLFEYEALVNSGEVIKGIFDGNQIEFEKMIVQKKLTIINVKENKKELSKGTFNGDDFLAFIEELYYLVKSGMQIDQSLKMLMKTATKQSQYTLYSDIVIELRNGVLLSQALKSSLLKQKVYVDALSISFVSTAEEVGSIADGLSQLFDYLSFQKQVKSDIRQALSYPFFLLLMSVVVALIIFFLIIPKFASIFTPEEFEQLPALSYAVLSLGAFLTQYMTEFFLLFGSLLVGLIFFFKNYNIPWLSLLYRIPKISTIVIDIQLSIVYSALSTTMIGGLELDRALKQLQKVNLLPELSNLLKNALFEIKRGQKLSTVFALSQVVPPSDIALLHVGESSASLPEIFASLSKRHNDAFNIGVKKALSLLEPTVIVGLGVFIAIIVVSIMMAVMSMTDVAA
ncbi:MAG: type II secretion system F family protein [Campylobacterota bacterium]|nr:type II secretion system F family protein [Campylobacterota bacterium]